LTLHVRFVLINSMPVIAIAFNRQARTSAFNYYVDPLTRDIVLRDDAKPFANQRERNIYLKPTIKRLWRIHKVSVVVDCSSLKIVTV
jgi:hypothetical protein